jgi:anti-sigma factor RsiW
MHAVVMDSLEEYLSGSLTPAALRDIEAHLSGCNSCREEIRSLQDVSQLFVSLRSDETPEPSLGFYAGVMRQVETRQNPQPATSGLFALNFLFARRLAFGSLLALALLGGFLITHEPEIVGSPSPEAIMAQQDAPTFDSAPAHDNMLVTLTAYEQR